MRPVHVFLLLLTLFFNASGVWAQAPCTHYASPSGSGSSCTANSPCTAQTLVNSQAQPGRVLCLKDGSYTGDSGMLQIPASWAGTASQPITIRAVNRGKVWIDGQDVRRPVHVRGTYGILDGINLRLGDNANLRFDGASSKWLVRFVVSYDVGQDGDANLQMSGSGNTVEDSAFFGRGRKPIAAGAAGGTGNTVRRTWARWEANTHPSSRPANAAEMGYGQDNVTFENVYLTWDAKGSSTPTEYEGITEIMRTQNSHFLGSILYLKGGEQFQPPMLTFGVVDAGSHAQQGDFHSTKHLRFTHNLSYVSPSHSKFADLQAYVFMEGTDGGPPGEDNQLSASVGVAGKASAFSSSWPTSQMQLGTSLAAAIGSGKSVWTDSVAAPGLCYRYVNRQRTTTPQWPWPLEQQLDDAMQHVGLPSFRLTATLENLLGPIPAACKGGGPVPPQPGDTTPPVVTLTSPSNDSLISGQVTVAATATDDSGTVQSITLTLGNEDMQTYEGASFSQVIDTTKHPNDVYVFGASAIDAAGNKGVSTRARVLVYNGARPPEPPSGVHPRMSCSGHLKDAGILTLDCEPQAR